MTYAEFVLNFPELANAPSEKVKAALARAALRVPSFWGSLRAEGIGTLAAHLLATGPGGFGVRTDAKPTTNDPYAGSAYGTQFAELCRLVTLRGPRVS